MPERQIESIQIKPLEFPLNGLVAFAVIKYAGLILSSIGIHTLRNSSRYRITYPTKKSKDHDNNVFNPYSLEVSALIEREIVKEYKRLYEK